MKYCRYCGAELQDGAEICKNCGCRVAQVPAEPSTSKSELSIPALVGFILSAVAILIMFFVLIIDSESTAASFLCAMPLAIAGFVCSIVGLVKAKRNRQRGKGFAIAGIVLGAVVGAFWLFVLTMGFLAFICGILLIYLLLFIVIMTDSFRL